jgi:hypothetical protein
MVLPKFNLRIHRKIVLLGEYCRGQAAFKTGRFPLIKDRETINRRLDEKVKNGEECIYCSILTNTEERMIVEFAKK